MLLQTTEYAKARFLKLIRLCTYGQATDIQIFTYLEALNEPYYKLSLTSVIEDTLE